jgi:cupin 2 domain-containing protein
MADLRVNLFADAEPPCAGERFDVLLEARNAKVERIVSSAAPEPTLYDQPEDEWVVLLRGTAVVEVAGESRALEPGDILHLPAHTPHRVLATSHGALWLAVHIAR